MICKKCKRKLHVRRTSAESVQVIRERYCPKCKMHTETIEVPIEETIKKQLDWQERVDKMVELHEEVEAELESTKETVKDFFLLAKKISK